MISLESSFYCLYKKQSSTVSAPYTSKLVDTSNESITVPVGFVTSNPTALSIKYLVCVYFTCFSADLCLCRILTLYSIILFRLWSYPAPNHCLLNLHMINFPEIICVLDCDLDTM